MGIDIKSSLKSAMNFMTPGVGAIHQDNGKPPIGAAPGVGTTSSGARFEQGLAGKVSGMFGTNMGAISADSYMVKPSTPAAVPSGLAAVSEEDKLKQQLSTQQRPAFTQI